MKNMDRDYIKHYIYRTDLKESILKNTAAYAKFVP
jgi:hypothetical protein